MSRPDATIVDLGLSEVSDKSSDSPDLSQDRNHLFNDEDPPFLLTQWDGPLDGPETKTEATNTSVVPFLMATTTIVAHDDDTGRTQRGRQSRLSERSNVREGDGERPFKDQSTEQPRERIPKFKSMEEYEARMKEKSKTKGPSSRIFFKHWTNKYGTKEFRGTGGRYEKPLQLGPNTPRLNLAMDLPAFRPHYAIVCFYIPEGKEGLKFIRITWGSKMFLNARFIPLEEGSPFVRILLRYQIAGTSFALSTEFKNNSKPAPLYLCYIDVVQEAPSGDSFDCILPFIPLPRHSFNVWHTSALEYRERAEPVTIIRFAISATGSHAATLCLKGKRPCVDVWELKLQDSTKRAVYPSPPSVSSGFAFLESARNEFRQFYPVLSWDGSQLAIFRSPKINAGSVNHYTFEKYAIDTAHPSQDPNYAARLVPTTRLQSMVDLQSFGGYATFTNTAQPGWTDHTERFLACDGVTLFIFSVADDWKLLYRINVSPKPDHGISKYLTDTTAGGLFILKESPYEISVWSIASGTALHHVQSKFKVSKYYIASDGATFGISTEQVMFLYSTLTGELVQTVSIPALGKAGFLEGASQLISRRFRDGMINFSIQSTSNTKLRKMILAPPWGKATLKDVWPVWKDPKVDGPSALVAMDHGSFLDVSFVQDMVMRDDGSRLRSCGPHCASRVLPLPHFTESCTNAFIDGSATYDLKISGEDGDRFQRLNISIRYNDGKLKRLHLVARRFYFLPKHHRVVSVDREKKGSLHYSIYNLPKMQLEELELSLYWELAASGESYEVLACSHERNLTTRINDTRLSVGKVCAPENMAYFFAPFERLVQQHWQALAENNPERAHAIIRYLRTHINYYSSPGDHSQSVITAICKVWHTGRHESYRAFLYQLLRHDLENQWEPRAKYSIGSNPVAIMLEKAKRNPKALDAVHIIIGQNIERARREQDVTCIQYLCECLDDLVARHREVALRVTRGFAFIKCNDRRFVISHHKIIHPPTLHRLWSVENQRIYQIRNPILQLDYRRQKDNPLNETFTEDIFVAPMNLLWTFVPDKYNSCQEYCRVNTKPKITWATALVHMAVLNFAPTSHVYIRTRFYRLEVLDNPAVVALVQYKWNTFAYALWVARFTTQCVFYVLILIAASMQIYYPKPDSLLGVFVAIVAFSCFFLWLEFLQWRESKYYTSIGYEEDMLSSGKDDSEMDKETAAQVILERGIAKSGGDDGGVPKKTPTQPQRADVQASASMSTLTSAKDTEHGKGSLKYSRERSPYFRSPYNILDLAMYLVPLATSVHQIVNIAQSGTDGVIWDFSFCVVLVLLHLLAELRVSETVCKYITIVIDAIREIRVFFVVLGGVVLCFSLAILHVLHGVGGDLWPRPNVNLPSNYIGAVTTVYLMMGGRYDPLEDDLSGGSDSGGTPGYKHWPLLVMVMIYFFFSSILMLNVLIALINVAFNKVDDSWRQVWLENRLRYVESAENISYHIPGFRETFDWFPSQIYYTANPYQVKQYWRRVNRKDEEILMEDEIQEFSLKPTPTSDAGDILMMDPVEDWATSEAVSTSPLLVSKIDEIQKAVSTKSEDDRSLLHEHFKEHGAGIQQQLEKYSREMEGRFEQQDQAVQEQRMQVTRLWSGSENVQRDVDQLREAVERTQEDIAEIKQDLRTLLAALLPAPKEE